MDSATWSDSLTRLLESKGTEKFVLPPLRDEPGFFERMGRRLFEWLAAQLPRGTGLPDLKHLVGAFVLLAAVTLTGVVIYALYLTLRSTSRRLGVGASGFTPAIETSREDFLEKLFREARAAGRWPEAARLRWKLFLFRSRLAESLTPLEHLHEPAFYRLMFAGSDEGGFEEMLAQLDKLETHAR